MTPNYILCANLYSLLNVLRSVSSLKNYMNFFLILGRMMFLHLIDTSRVIIIEKVFFFFICTLQNSLIVTYINMYSTA